LGKAPGSTLHTLEEWREEETETLCPACSGCGKVNIVRVEDKSNVGTYRFILCGLCLGKGTVKVSTASGFRRKAAKPSKT
jgi:formate dehydrogenase maturation protein FdhE